MSRLLIVSGPSCAGKSPLVASARAWFSDDFAGMKKLVLYHSRAPRPHEREGEAYHFRSREQIEALRDERHLIIAVRDQLQAVDMADLAATLEEGDAVHEGDYRVALALMGDERVRALAKALSVFVSPLSAAEIRDIRGAHHGADLPAVLTAMMRQRLLRRLRAQKPSHGPPDLEDVEKRARDAIPALREAHRFDAVIVNHDGEDSDHWTLFEHPLGDARRAVLALRELYRGGRADGVERWPADLVP